MKISLKQARLWIVLVGILLPWLSRLPGGFSWVAQYFSFELVGYLYLSAFNALGWASILGISYLYKNAQPLLISVVLGFGFMTVGYFSIDLAEDALMGLVLISVPIIALGPILIGGVIGYIWDKKLNRKSNADSEPL